MRSVSGLSSLGCTPSRIRSSLVAVASMALAVSITACQSDGGEPASAPQPAAPTSAAASASPSAVSSSADEPALPPGAKDWPVRDLDSCDDLSTVSQKRLAVRVPSVDLACLIHSTTNDDLLVLAETVKLPTNGPRVAVPGFEGKATAPLPSLDRADVVLLQPAQTKGAYLLVHQGGGRSTSTVLERLFRG